MKELQNELINLTKICNQLSQKLDGFEEWDEVDDKRLEKLSKIVALIVKLYPFSTSDEIEEVSAKEDDEIIARFLERNKFPEE